MVATFVCVLDIRQLILRIATAVSWTLYGLIASQLGDVHDDFITQEDGTRTPVADYIYQYACCISVTTRSLADLQHLQDDSRFSIVSNVQCAIVNFCVAGTSTSGTPCWATWC